MLLERRRNVESWPLRNPEQSGYNIRYLCRSPFPVPQSPIPVDNKEPHTFTVQ